jgi:hypothetical protein
MEVIPSEYKIDEMPFSMASAHEYEMTEYRADDADVKNAQNIRIQIKDLSTYTNLSNSYLEVKFKVVNAVSDAGGGDVALTGDAPIAPTNGIQSVFSRCVLRVQNQIVETLDEQHISSMVKGLLHYSQDFASSAGTNEFFYVDRGNLDATATSKYSHSNAVSVTDGAGVGALTINPNPDYNSGWVSRFNKTKNSQENTAIIPLSSLFGFCSVDRVISGNLIAVELTRSAVEQHLHATGAQTGKVSFGKISLWAPRILPSPSIDLALKSAMGGGVRSTYKFPLYNSYVSSNLSNGSGTALYKVLTQTEKILQVFVMLRKGGVRVQDPKTATLNEFNELEIRLNGRNYPSRRYDNLTNNEGKSRAYLELLKYMNRSNDYSSGIQLSYEDWQKTSIYSFDCSAQPDNWSRSPSTLEISGNLTTAGDQAGTRQYLVCVVSERMVQIDFSGSQPTVAVM